MVDACATRLQNRGLQVRVLPPLLPSEVRALRAHDDFRRLSPQVLTSVSRDRHRGRGGKRLEPIGAIRWRSWPFSSRTWSQARSTSVGGRGWSSSWPSFASARPALRSVAARRRSNGIVRAAS
jgi:hypothetical protein